MDIITLAARGEFLGGIGVIISLIYLASQIRRNSRLLRASTASATSQNTFSGSAMIVQDPDVARIYWAGIEDRDSLQEGDRQRFDPCYPSRWTAFFNSSSSLSREWTSL